MRPSPCRRAACPGAGGSSGLAGTFADAGVGLQQRHQHRAVVSVSPGQPHVQRKPVAVAEHVVLAARLTALGRAGTGRLRLARTLTESTAAQDQSSFPCWANRSSTTRCSWSHTTARCQARRRRQHAAPRPAAQLERQRVPRHPGGQHEHDPGQHGPIRHSRPTVRPSRAVGGEVITGSTNAQSPSLTSRSTHDRRATPHDDHQPPDQDRVATHHNLQNGP